MLSQVWRSVSHDQIERFFGKMVSTFCCLAGILRYESVEGVNHIVASVAEQYLQHESRATRL